MTNKTRKRLWPVSLVMAIAVIGVVAAFLVVASYPTNTQAHDGASGSTHCDDLGTLGKIAHDEDTNNDHDCATGPAEPSNTAPMAGDDIAAQMVNVGGTVMVPSTITDADDGDTLEWEAMSSDDMIATAEVDDMGMVTITGVGEGTATITVTATDGDDETATQTIMVTVSEPGMDMIDSSSTSASATVKLTLDIAALPMDLDDGSSIVLYLEDDYTVPDSIDADDVYFIVPGSEDQRTNNGGRVFVNYGVEISDDNHFGGDDDWDIQIFVPDFDIRDVDGAAGFQAPMQGEPLQLVITKAAGIKNPSEAHDNDNEYADGYKASYAVLGPGASVKTLPDDSGKDLNELIVKAKIALSDEDNDRGYELTVTGSGFNNGVTAAVYVKGYSSTPATAPSCSDIITTGIKVGDANVGSDDKAVVTFEVTAPNFKPGEDNYLCMEDGEGRMSFDDVEQFELQPSIRVSPTEVSSGDTVTVFAQDFQGGGFDSLKLSGQQVNPTATGSLPMVRVSAEGISPDGSATAIFNMPGGLEGTVRVDASWGGASEDTKITIAPSTVNASKTDVLPNESITLTGNGFAGSSCVPASRITLDKVAVKVDEESLSQCTDDKGTDTTSDDETFGKAVEVSNAGQFVATIHLSPASGGSDPTLIAGRHTLDVEDSKGFTGSVVLNIADPAITVTPEVAGPRDYITVSGENWPVDNPENPLSEAVKVMVNDAGSRAPRQYSAFADTSGRFSIEHQVHRGVAIPSTIQVEVKYADIVKIQTFDVPVATITVDPGEAQPGDMISISATNMPVYTDADEVKIGGSVISSLDAHTDRDGNITIEDVLVPGLDPGTYSVQLTVKGTVAIGEINVLAESAAGGAPVDLPGAVESLDDNLVAIFYYDDVGKEWAFYDPRPDFADLNTLTQLSNGEAYWLLVSETVEDVVLNNKVRSLTCRGEDCWNLEVW